MELAKTDKYEVKPVIWALLFGGLFTAFGPLVLMKEVDKWNLIWWVVYFLGSQIGMGIWLGIMVFFKKGFGLIKTLFTKRSFSAFEKIKDDEYRHNGVPFVWMFIPHAFMTWWSYSWWISDNLAYTSWLMVLFGLIQGFTLYKAYKNGYLPEDFPYYGFYLLVAIIAILMLPFTIFNGDDSGGFEDTSGNDRSRWNFSVSRPTFYKRFKNYEDFR